MYKYRIKSKTTQVTYWACTNQLCRAKLHTYDLESYKEVGEHNHPLDDLTEYIKQFIVLIKTRVAQDPYETGNSIYNHCLRELSESIIEDEQRQYVRTHIGSYESYCTRIYTEKHMYYPQQSNYGIDFLFDRSRAITSDGKDFLFLDMFDELNDVVFAELEYIKKFHLDGCKLFMDGTFKTSSTQFYQLFIIHTLKDDVSFPLFYCFLNNKTFITYENLLNRIVAKLNQNEIIINPTMVLIDFEEASYKAIRSVFPQAGIKGCYFHFGQAVWRNCMKLGFKRLYDTNYQFKKLIKLTMALPLVPCLFVDSGWNLICNLIPQIDEDISEFTNYFQNTWLSSSRPLFNLSTWNHFDNPAPRTNNSAEGFHSKLSKLVNRNRPNFYQILETLIDVQFQMEVYLDRLEAGLPAKARKKKYILADQTVQRLKSQFNRTNDFSLINYMMNISNAIKFILE